MESSSNHDPTMSDVYCLVYLFWCYLLRVASSTGLFQRCMPCRETPAVGRLFPVLAVFYGDVCGCWY